MGHVFDNRDARQYEELCQSVDGTSVEQLRRQLVLRLVHPLPGERVLDIGCGTGRDLSMFLDHGLSLTGIDPSAYMLDLARQRLGHRAELYRARGERLPFEDNAFDVAMLCGSLEFVENPRAVLIEASRVAKDRVFIGCMNRYAIKGIERRIKGRLEDSVYRHAHFFSVWELKYLVRETLGNLPINWRTCCHLTDGGGGYRERLERVDWLRRLPTGSFVAMVVTLTCNLRVTPLELRHKPVKAGKLITGPARTPFPRPPRNAP